MTKVKRKIRYVYFLPKNLSKHKSTVIITETAFLNAFFRKLNTFLLFFKKFIKVFVLFISLVRVSPNIAIFTPLAYRVVVFHEH